MNWSDDYLTTVPPPIAAGMGDARAKLFALLSLHPGEGARTFLSFVYLFLVIAAYLLMKAIRNAFFISEFGALKLPYVMLGIAVLTGILVSGYIRLARRIPSDRLTVYSLLFFASNALCFWWWALDGTRWLYPVLYVWAGIFGVISTTQVWTLANDLFTVREAKRTFGVIGSGGILGAAVGGSIAFRLAPRIGTTHLLLIVAGLLLAAAATVAALGRLRTAQLPVASSLPPPRNLRESVRTISRSSHLRLLAGLVFVTALATTTVDFQFNVVASETIKGRDALTAFFGAVYGSTSVLAFALQILLTSRFLSRVGVGVSILLLPLSLISGTAALLLSKGVWAGVLLKGSDGALKHSLDRSCRELMYLPVPKHVKVQTKSTIDTVMDRLGDGTAGALQLVLVEGIGAGLGASLFVNLIVVFVWLGLAFRLKGEYVTQLRTTLAAPGGEDVAIGGLADEAEARRILDGLLAAGSEQEKLAALEWTSHARPGAVDEKRLLALARADGSPAVRRAALAVLLGGGDVDLPEGLVEGLEEEGQAALVSAIDVVIEADAEGSADRLSALLGRSGETTRLPLLAFMVRRLGPEFEPFAVRVFDALLAPGVPSRSRRDAVRSLALLPAGASPLLRLPELLRDPDPQVAGAAAEVVASRDVPDLLPSLVELLGRPGARPAARRALSAFGTRAQEPLVAALRDGAHARAVRRQVPSLLAAVPASNAIEALAEGLRDADPVVADRCLGALGEVRRKNVGPLPFRAAWVGREAVEQARRYADAARLRDEVAAASTGPSDALRWVADALESERARALKGVFAVLAVEYPIYDMRGICLAVSEGGGVERANALELLANVLPHPLSGTLVPVLERALQGGTGTPPPGGRPGRAELLGSLARSPVPWIAATALHAARVSGVTGIEAAARAAARSADPAVREEAEALLGTAHEGVPA